MDVPPHASTGNIALRPVRVQISPHSLRSRNSRRETCACIPAPLAAETAGHQPSTTLPQQQIVGPERCEAELQGGDRLQGAVLQSVLQLLLHIDGAVHHRSPLSKTATDALQRALDQTRQHRQLERSRISVEQPLPAIKHTGPFDAAVLLLMLFRAWEAPKCHRGSWNV